MALTPYPSLATLPEVVANGGRIPGSFLGRTIYASAVPGVVLDCDLTTGAKVGGGTPTDNAAALSAALAPATASAPVRLVIDGGAAMGSPLVMPATGHVTIEGQGWDTGLFMLAGANSSAIQNFPGTDLAERKVWTATSTLPAGANVAIRNLKIHGNRGTYPSGNSDGTRDGTITDGSILSTPADARGPSPGAYWLSGIILDRVDNVHIEDVWVYDAPAYHVNLYACTRVWIDDSRFQAGDPSFSGNTDGIHFNGGCGHAFVSDCWFSTGDDGVAINIDEGNAVAGGDFLVHHCTFLNCQSAGRVYGQSAATRRVTFDHCIGSGMRAWAFQVGNSSPFITEANHSVYFRNCEVGVSGPSIGYGYSFLFLNGACGLIEAEGCHIVDPTVAIPFMLYGFAQPTVSAIRMLDCGVHRSAGGSAACPAFATESGGQVGDLTIRDFHLTEQRNNDGTYGHYADVAAMVDLGHVTVGHLSLSGSFRGAATIVNVPSTASVASIDVPDLTHASNAGSATAHSFVNASGSIPLSIGRLTGSNIAGIASGPFALVGPGVMPSGFPVADALMGNNTPYLGSDHGGVPCVKVAGTAKTVNLT
jgi:hypothetical protein